MQPRQPLRYACFPALLPPVRQNPPTPKSSAGENNSLLHGFQMMMAANLGIGISDCTYKVYHELAKEFAQQVEEAQVCVTAVEAQSTQSCTQGNGWRPRCWILRLATLVSWARS